MFRTNKKTKKRFECNHRHFHKNCIRICTRCPLCRAKRISTENRILTWHECQRIPAEVFKKSNNLSMDIVVMISNAEKKRGDIIYNFS